MQPADLPPRIASKIHVNPDTGCWEWTGTRNSVWGHGSVRWGRMRYAHRVVYELLVGPIPNGLVIDHLCRVTHCVNPAHLEPVTNRENILRGVGASAQHAQKTHCPAGHEYTPDNTYTYPHGARRCRTCHRKQDLARLQRIAEKS